MLATITIAGLLAFVILIVVLIARGPRKTCPGCVKRIPFRATRCRFCGLDLTSF